MNVRLALFILSLFGVAGAAVAEEAPTAPATGSRYAGLLDKMAEARELVAKTRLATSRVDGGDAILAVWDGTSEGRIDLVTLKRCVSRTPGFTVECPRFNGVSPDYRVTTPDGYVVLAAKVNVCSERRCRRTKTVAYTPYSAGIHTPETVAAGRDYLDGLLARAAAELDERDVASRVVPGSRVTETANARILLAILIVEHARSDKIAELGIRRVVEEVLVVIGANGENAYDHALSHASAKGLAQFIRSSYQLTRQRYPAAVLIPDFDRGAADHGNVVKAQYCLADWTLTSLRQETLADLRLPLFEEDLGAYVAAAYNGGEKRAAKALYRYPDSWERRGHGLYQETVDYVRAFREVYRFLNAEPAENDGSLSGQNFDP